MNEKYYTANTHQHFRKILTHHTGAVRCGCSKQLCLIGPLCSWQPPVYFIYSYYIPPPPSPPSRVQSSENCIIIPKPSEYTHPRVSHIINERQAAKLAYANARQEQKKESKLKMRGETTNNKNRLEKKIIIMNIFSLQ